MSTISSIERHVRSYRSALKSTMEITINSLTNSHLKMNSILHPLGNNPLKLDTDALVYTLLRLPSQIDNSEKIILGQSPEVFIKTGFDNVESWPKVSSKARRCTSHFNKTNKTLAYFAASISDIDDIVNLLIAYQTEWNKFHKILTLNFKTFFNFTKDLKSNQQFLKYLNITPQNWLDITTALGPKYMIRLKHIFQHNHNLRVRLLAGSWTDYTKTTQKWWKNIAATVSDQYHISHQEIYFVSGSNKQNQKELNIININNSHYLNINTQIFPVKNLIKVKHLDPRLKISKPKKLSNSKALIFNIDYPLGFSAYHILSEVIENIKRIKGIYILGKAAVLNGEIGDIQIPKLVFDEHTQNSYLFKNCFNTFFPFINNQGSILTNQKAVSVLGTFLENKALLDVYSKNNLTVIEMESGPYLNAITEATVDQQTPNNTIVDLNNAPFDIGIINYTSDTPYSQTKNLGTAYSNLKTTETITLGSLAILQRIINLEESK